MEALEAVKSDMESPKPMDRLICGDVGYGKTEIALRAAFKAVMDNKQVAILVPTTVLAQQHYLTFCERLSAFPVEVKVLSRFCSDREQSDIIGGLSSGNVDICIGTHRLLQKDILFKDLGLLIIDEEQRFGVVHKEYFKKMRREIDILTLTATPIPRSLSLTLYGDLDVSTIDQMPPGRKPIQTLWLEENKRHHAYDAIQETVRAGRQVYVVYPLVEESEKSDLRAAKEMAEYLREEVFRDVRIGLLHGRMKSTEKEETMLAFAAGTIQILVATTVIEVGVDVANATLMVIEHAERFGLAQLHQLRGRVGRGQVQSTCIMIADAHNNPEARRRLEIMCETNNGFRIAEVDLELRGPGEMIGTRQSGMPSFKYADLVRDRKALEIARVEAERFLQILRTHPDNECRRAALLIQQQGENRFEPAMTG